MKKIILIFVLCYFANCRNYSDFRSKNYVPPTSILPSQGFYLEDISPYIVGGTEADPHSLPYQVALYVDGEYFCGGFLISPDWVVTAAHCTNGATSIVVLLGAHDRTIAEPSQVSLESSVIITHEEYSTRTYNHDIGLIKLPEPVTFTDEIQPIALPSSSDEDLNAGVNVTVSGWGLTSDDAMANFSKTLNEVTVSTITNEECAKSYSSLSIQTGKLCTSGAEGEGPCIGDIGGPLTYDSLSGRQVRGIFSFISISGCTTGYPAAYTRVTHYLDWIETQTGVTF